MPGQIKGFGRPSGRETPLKKPLMKKSNHSSKALDPPKPVRAMTPVKEKQHLLPVSAANISPERVMDGVSITTEVLNEILQRQKPPEHMRH